RTIHSLGHVQDRMEAPSLKRRKTSPVTFAPVGSKNDPVQTRVPSTAGWPSYLSPTKPSLARYNPHLHALKLAAPKTQSPLRRASPQLLSRTEANKEFDAVDRHDEYGWEHNDQFHSRKHESSGDRLVLKEAGRRLMNGNAAFPSKSEPHCTVSVDELPQGPRASPPEAAEAANQLNHPDEASLHDDNEAYTPPQNAFRDETPKMTPSKPSYNESGYTEDDEPTLPSTPTQLGLEPPPRPPSGLLSRNSSRKSRSRQRVSQSSSPLKDRYAQLQTPRARQNPVIATPAGPASDSRIRFVRVSSPDNLLTVKLRLKYEKLGEKLLEMVVWELSGWAEGELGRYIRDLVAKKDLVCIRQAVKQYWELSKERASCWTACEQDLQSSVQSHLVTRPNSREDPDPLQEGTVKTLLPMHGRQNLMLCHDGIALVIRWKIVPCSSGELERRLSTSVIIEDDGAETDGAADSNEVDEVFSALLNSSKSVIGAIKVVAQTVFNDPIAML
ncbi:MAG: hypothetical protein Q9225_002448, partial [Loekoesia sp. 1 TL-2023]